MKNISIKAFLLSAFVLPGIGQLYKGEKIKGAILLALVNIFLLAALFAVLRGIGPLLLAAKTGDVTQTAQYLDNLSRNSPGSRWLLAGFAALWFYGAVDALISRKEISK